LKQSRLWATSYKDLGVFIARSVSEDGGVGLVWTTGFDFSSYGRMRSRKSQALARRLAASKSWRACRAETSPMKAALLDDVFLRVAEARTRQDLHASLIELASRHDCGSGDLVVVTDGPGGSASFEVVYELPQAYLAAYFGGDAKNDPVMQHVKHSCRPIIWSQQTYSAVGKRSEWECMADCGLVTGASLALHLPSGRHLVLSLDWAREQDLSSSRWTAVIGEMQLFAAHAAESAFGILARATESYGAPELTRRELEVLQWTVAGKTAWETGRILSISERTVAKYAATATAKLGCSSKHQAAVRAMRLKLIN
jgi:DNA-binding CsgD family transcriptional regulator